MKFLIVLKSGWNWQLRMFGSNCIFNSVKQKYSCYDLIVSEMKKQQERIGKPVNFDD